MSESSNAGGLGPNFRMQGVVYPAADQLRSYVDAGLLGKESLVEGFMAAHATHRARLALMGPEGSFTHGQLDDVSNRVAAAFLDLGLAPLDRVIFQVSNCNELIFGYLGCLKAGLIPVCSLASHREREIGYLATHSEAKLHFVQGDDPKFDHVAFAERIQASAPLMKHIVVARGPARGSAMSLKTLYESQDSSRARDLVLSIPRDPFQVVLFHLSGGTTGLPKIIPRFASEYLYMMRAIADWNEYVKEDVFYCPLPFMHNANMLSMSGPALLVGGAIALAMGTDTNTVETVIREYKPTQLMCGPLLAKLAPRISEGHLDLSHVKVIHASRDAPKISKLTGGVQVRQLFGMGEGVTMWTKSSDCEDVRNLSVGRPVSPMERVRIMRPGTEDEVQIGEIGEPVFQGPSTIRGYYKAPERNAEAFTSDGYLRSGDLMSCRQIDGNAYYFFEGRIKDVVSRGSEKINSAEVEEAVSLYSGIDACALIGLKDDVMGERACVCIVMRDGQTPPDVAQLGRHLENYGLAKFKWPERIEVLSSLPVTHVGKVDKAGLKKRFEPSSQSV